MIDFYLITGFLGSGKTTFLKQFLHLMEPHRIHLIINEFGQEGVDGTLVREMNTALSEINNGSIFCACRLDKFEEVLTDVLAQKPDIVIAEASGLADPTGIRRVLEQFPEIAYQGSICLTDAVRLPKVFNTAILCRKQLAISSLVLLNKTDVATAEQCETCRTLILQANPAATIFKTQYGHILPTWLDTLYPVPDDKNISDAQDITLQKACLEISEMMDSESLYRCLAQLCENTYRIKGFLQLHDGRFLVNCTGSDVQLVPWSGEATNRLVLLAGKGMPLRKSVKQALSWYTDFITVVPDV